MESHMTPQVPEYLVTFEAAVRPLVAAIVLGLIWMGAGHEPLDPFEIAHVSKWVISDQMR
jgi:hypothetical protein